MKFKAARVGIIFITLFYLTSCMLDSRSQIINMDESQVQIRSVQTRIFDTSDTAMVFRSVIATLQDLGFVIEKADDTLDIVSATKLSGYVMRMTVMVRQNNPHQAAVRASAQYNLTAVSDPQPYQQFFDALSKSLFLAANKID